MRDSQEMERPVKVSQIIAQLYERKVAPSDILSVTVGTMCLSEMRSVTPTTRNDAPRV